MDWKAVLEESFACKVLEIRALHPSVDHSFIGQAMQMLQVHQACHQSRGCGWPSCRRWEEPGPFLIEELPIHQGGELHQLMTHVDQIHEPGAQQIFLFRGTITVLHGETKLQGYQCDNTKICRK